MNYFDSNLHKRLDKYGNAGRAYWKLAGIGPGAIAAGILLFGPTSGAGITLIVVGLVIVGLTIVLSFQFVAHRRHAVAVSKAQNLQNLETAAAEQQNNRQQ